MTWMTWRSEATLTAREPSTTRCTSSSPISRSERATATTPVEFWDQMCVPPSETTTDSMRWPAMRSAETAASWMAAMVLSRLTTTPLRRPSQRASPTPTTLTAPPTSSDSEMTTATRLVPRSRPTVFFRRDKTVLERLLERGDGCGRVAGIISAPAVARHKILWVGRKSGLALVTPRWIQRSRIQAGDTLRWIQRSRIDLLKVVAPDGAQVVEDPHPERDDR